MPVTILGIRHHGVGSAKNVRQQLQSIQPDLILVEGPSEISSVLGLVGHEDLKPPVSIMVFDPSNPKISTFYPFARYSPEWVAASFANAHKIPLRAIDLPAAISFHQKSLEEAVAKVPSPNHKDPLSHLAEIAGFSDSEQWWDHYFERHTSSDSAGHFEAVEMAMTALRNENIPSTLDEENVWREAYMRNCIRTGLLEMYVNIVVVCGAWHAPALLDLESTYKSDQKIIKALPKSKLKIACTWIPWTNERLSMQSGYGAGIQSPGWYGHLWKNEEDVAIKWLSKVAQTFRSNKIDVSAAHVIETYRLAQSLAALRQKSTIGLTELNEAVVAVMCTGDAILLRYIEQDLIIANKLGTVPKDIPKVPLQADFEQQLKSLRIVLTVQVKEYRLDLRKQNDLNRSVFFHRLAILEIKLAKSVEVRTKGTFRETWSLQYDPALMIALIDKSYLGNTIIDAALLTVQQKSSAAKQIRELLPLIQEVLYADLPQAVLLVLGKIQALAAISSDVLDLMIAFSPLVDLNRYGDVRKSELSLLTTIVDELFIKIVVGLEQSCYGLNEEQSYQLFELIGKVNDAVRLLQREDMQRDWYDVLRKLLHNQTIHKIVSGCVCRLIFDAQLIDKAEAQQQFSFALSPTQDPLHVASWLEGFLRKSGLILLYDHQLWNLIYEWVEQLDAAVFVAQLPFLRRTFAKFEFSERKKIGMLARQGLANSEESDHLAQPSNFNKERSGRMMERLKTLVVRPN